MLFWHDWHLEREMIKSRLLYGALLALFTGTVGAQSDEAQDSEDDADEGGLPQPPHTGSQPLP